MAVRLNSRGRTRAHWRPLLSQIDVWTWGRLMNLAGDGSTFSLHLPYVVTRVLISNNKPETKPTSYSGLDVSRNADQTYLSDVTRRLPLEKHVLPRHIIPV